MFAFVFVFGVQKEDSSRLAEVWQSCICICTCICFVFEVQREDSSPGWRESGRVASVHSLSSTSHMDTCTTGAHWQALLVQSGAEEDALASVQAV